MRKDERRIEVETTQVAKGLNEAIENEFRKRFKGGISRTGNLLKTRRKVKDGQVFVPKPRQVVMLRYSTQREWVIRHENTLATHST